MLHFSCKTNRCSYENTNVKSTYTMVCNDDFGQIIWKLNAKKNVYFLLLIDVHDQYIYIYISFRLGANLPSVAVKMG